MARNRPSRPTTKEIRLICHEPMSIDPTAAQAWADVYVEYRCRPGRRVNLGPTLSGRADLEGMLRMNARLLARLGPVGHASMRALIEEDMAQDRARLARLAAGETLIIDSEGPEDAIPTLYTAAPLVTRRESERMITGLLRARGLTAPLRFRWAKNRSGFVATPWSAIRMESFDVDETPAG